MKRDHDEAGNSSETDEKDSGKFPKRQKISTPCSGASNVRKRKYISSHIAEALVSSKQCTEAAREQNRTDVGSNEAATKNQKERGENRGVTNSSDIVDTKTDPINDLGAAAMERAEALIRTMKLPKDIPCPYFLAKVFQDMEGYRADNDDMRDAVDIAERWIKGKHTVDSSTVVDADNKMRIAYVHQKIRTMKRWIETASWSLHEIMTKLPDGELKTSLIKIFDDKKRKVLDKMNVRISSEKEATKEDKKRKETMGQLYSTIHSCTEGFLHMTDIFGICKKCLTALDDASSPSIQADNAEDPTDPVTTKSSPPFDDARLAMLELKDRVEWWERFMTSRENVQKTIRQKN